MTTFGGQTVPPLFQPAPAGGTEVVEVTVNNSAVQGIVSFGPWAFPMEPSCTRGHIKLWRRDAAGDTLIFDDVYDAAETNDFVAYVWKISGTNFDLGGNGYSTDGTTGFPGGTCTGVCSHGRWETAAGVSRVVQRTTKIQIVRNLAGGSDCPGDELSFEKEYDITAVFTG